MPLFLVRYHYTDDAVALTRVRPRHREFLATLPGLTASGPTADNGAALVVEADSADDVSKLLDADPFAVEGLIAGRQVVEWTLVLGRWSQAR